MLTFWEKVVPAQLHTLCLTDHHRSAAGVRQMVPAPPSSVSSTVENETGVTFCYHVSNTCKTCPSGRHLEKI